MAATATANPQVASESKSARKKKARAAEAAPSTPDAERSASAAGLDGDVKVDGGVGGENAYIKDLQK
jgi:hypothetical protein